MMPATGAWDQREAEFVRRAVFVAALRPEPSPHLYVENVFSPVTYAEMLRLYPADASLHRWENPGEASMRFGNYTRRREIHIPAEAQRLPPEQRAFWLDVAAFLHGEHFARTLLARFEPYARARFGDAVDDESFVRDRLRGTMIVNEHDADYYLGPHTDRGEKVFTCLFYFPEHAGLDHLGTTLYRPLEDGFTCGGLAHHDPARFARRETIPYRPNSALMFARTDVMFHGVHALTAQELRGSKRRSIQMQFWVHNARPREACKTTLWAAAPDGIRAGGDELVPFRLTNRAAAELDSGFPYTTNLSYRWFDADGREVGQDDGVRTPLPRALAPGETAGDAMRVVAPSAPGEYVLRLSAVQEGVAWFDDVDPSNGVAAHVSVYDPAATDFAADVVPPGDDIALGDGWYPVERAGGAAFRWVAAGATVHVAALRPVRHVLRVVAEPGPGVGLQPFTLTARLRDGRELGAATVGGKQTIAFALPPEAPCVHSITLAAAGGGKASPNDARVLNFRVFSVAVERTRDVFAAWAVPASGFYPPERQDDELFRWARGGATVELDPARRDVLEFDAESGPGMGSKPFELRVTGDGGVELVRAEIGSRTRVRVPLRDAGASLRLNADGGGAVVGGDPRTLDFRVFALED
jgi:hypothetical protein